MARRPQQEQARERKGEFKGDPHSQRKSRDNSPNTRRRKWCEAPNLEKREEKRCFGYIIYENMRGCGPNTATKIKRKRNKRKKKN